MPSTTCFAGSATWTRPRSRRGSAARMRERASGRPGSGWRRSWRTAGRSGCASGRPGAGWQSRTSAASATGWESRRRSASRRRPWPRPGTRSAPCWLAGRAATVRSSPRIPPRAGTCREASSRRPWRDSWRRASSCGASSDPVAWSASGATRRSCGSCVGGRWRVCGARSNRSSRRRWRGSCPAGRASASRTGGVGRLAEVLAQLEGLPHPGLGARTGHPARARGGLRSAAAGRAGCRRGGRVGRPREPRSR